MTRLAPLMAAIVLVAATGYVNGLWTGRWSDTRAVAESAARLKSVPMEVGDWAGKDVDFDVKDYAAAGIEGALLRRYRNTRTGEEVTLMIVCGRPGPISVHTPDVCYPAAGYRLLSDRIATAVDLGGESARFWTLPMGKFDTVVPERLNVNFSWSVDGNWLAPDRDSRFVFAGSPVLFKLYAVRELSPRAASESPTADELAKDEVAVEFLKTIIPELRVLFAPAPAA
jgi:hypothetical protein